MKKKEFKKLLRVIHRHADDDNGKMYWANVLGDLEDEKEYKLMVFFADALKINLNNPKPIEMDLASLVGVDEND